MGWNDRMDDQFLCDECEDCAEECLQHEEPCDVCNVVNCICDNMYDAWKEQQLEEDN